MVLSIQSKPSEVERKGQKTDVNYISKNSKPIGECTLPASAAAMQTFKSTQTHQHQIA
jgi:hypothetical protein